MSDWLMLILYVSLVIHVIMTLASVWKIWRGENVIERLMGLDLITTLMMAIFVLFALIVGDDIYIDVALAVAALSFISTIALAKYSADEQVL